MFAVNMVVSSKSKSKSNSKGKSVKRQKQSKSVKIQKTARKAQLIKLAKWGGAGLLGAGLLGAGVHRYYSSFKIHPPKFNNGELIMPAPSDAVNDLHHIRDAIRDGRDHTLIISPQNNVYTVEQAENVGSSSSAISVQDQAVHVHTQPVMHHMQTYLHQQQIAEQISAVHQRALEALMVMPDAKAQQVVQLMKQHATLVGQVIRPAIYDIVPTVFRFMGASLQTSSQVVGNVARTVRQAGAALLIVGLITATLLLFLLWPALLKSRDILPGVLRPVENAVGAYGKVSDVSRLTWAWLEGFMVPLFQQPS